VRPEGPWFFVGKRPDYKRNALGRVRYDLSKLRAKLFLFERVSAPLGAGLLSPVKSDAPLEPQKRSQLDRLYQRVIDDLGTLVQAVGLKAA
jgi:hypothetical protein